MRIRTPSLKALLRSIVTASLALMLAWQGSGALAEDSKPQKIRVISYNVQFLPGPGRAVNKRKPLEYRAEQLGDKMADYDIVGLQGTFDDEPRELLLSHLKAKWGEDYHAVVHPKPEKRFNGGLLIASRWPILETHHTYYSRYSTPEEFGVTADGFAAKGILHARVALGKGAPTDDYVDVFVTHLEARADPLREFQYPELREFVKAHADASHPVLILGDMNTKGNIQARKDPESQYAHMMKNYSDARPGAPVIDVWPALKGDSYGGTTIQGDTEKGSRIDYILLSNPSSGLRLTPADIRVNPFLDPKTIALSDHSAVEADFTPGR